MDDCIGILYFHNHDKDDMIQAKKFFRIIPMADHQEFEEIDMLTYNNESLKFHRRANTNVDKDTKRHSSKS